MGLGERREEAAVGPGIARPAPPVGAGLAPALLFDALLFDALLFDALLSDAALSGAALSDAAL